MNTATPRALVLATAVAAGLSGAASAQDKASSAATPACVGDISERVMSGILDPAGSAEHPQYTLVRSALGQCQELFTQIPNPQKALKFLADRDFATASPEEIVGAFGGSPTGANRLLEHYQAVLADMRRAGNDFAFVAETPAQRARAELNEREKRLLTELSRASGGLLATMARQVLAERETKSAASYSAGSSAQALGGVGLLGVFAATWAWRYARRRRAAEDRRSEGAE